MSGEKMMMEVTKKLRGFGLPPKGHTSEHSMGQDYGRMPVAPLTNTTRNA